MSRILSALVFALVLHLHVKVAGQVYQVETSDSDNLILNDLDDSLLGSWEDQKRFLLSLSFVSTEEKTLIKESETPEELYEELKGKNSILSDIVFNINRPTQDIGSLNIRHMAAYNNEERSKTTIRLGLGKVELGWQQNVSNRKALTGAGIIYRNQQHITNIGNLLPRTGYGLVFGPARNAGVSGSGLRSAWKNSPSSRMVRLSNSSGLIRGASLSYSGKDHDWMFIGGKIIDSGCPGVGGAMKLEKGINSAGLTFFNLDFTNYKSVVSAMYSMNTEHFFFSFEIGSDGRAGRGCATLSRIEHGKLRYSLYLREFTGPFKSPLSRPPTKWSGKELNESGLFGAVEYRGSVTRLEVFFDQAWKPSNLSNVTYEKTGGLLRFQTQYYRYSLLVRNETTDNRQGILFIGQSYQPHKSKTVFKNTISTRHFYSTDLKLHSYIEKRITENDQGVMYLGMISAARDISEIRATLSLARSGNTGNSFTTYIYGLNLYGEAPGIPTRGKESVVGLKIRYKDTGKTIFAMKLLLVRSNKGDLTHQLTLIYSWSY